MATLYELYGAMRGFEYEVDEETGEILNDSTLEQLEMDYDDKLTNCIFYYKNMLAEANALKAEKMRLQARQKVAENKAERMKQYIAMCTDGNKWQSADGVQKVSYRKSTEVRADVAVLQQFGDEFLRYKEPEADKKKLAEALKAGQQIEGAELIEKQNVVIK